jgi:hypothetical protein
MPFRFCQLVGALAVVQIVDAVVSAAPQTSMASRLDDLGVPEVLRPVLPLIKVSTSAGLLVGRRHHRVGALTCASLVAFYAAAVAFHAFSGDPPVAALPATALGATAAVCLVCWFLPVIESGDSARGARSAFQAGPTSAAPMLWS